MTTKTDYMAITELDKTFIPAHRHYVNADEIARIKTALELENRTLIELNNVRDMTVMLFNIMEDHAGTDTDRLIGIMDKCSAIVHVIDCEIMSRR